MAQSVKLSDEVMALVRREAELHSRSVAGQITHWLKLGRAIEQSGSYDHARVTAALEGRLDTTQLREEEVLACVVLRRPRLATEAADAIFRHCHERLAYYKAPGWLHIVEALPTTGTQKIQKHLLRAE